MVASPARLCGFVAALAIVSALLTNYVAVDPWQALTVGSEVDPIPLPPAIYFGVTLCVAARLAGMRSPWRLAVVFAAVVVAWLGAWTTGHEVYVRLERAFPGSTGFGGASAHAPWLLAIAGLAAGFVGSAVTVAGIAIVSRALRRPASVARTVAIGAVAGVLLALNSVIDDLLPLFLVWQPAVAVSIVHDLARDGVSRAG